MRPMLCAKAKPEGRVHRRMLRQTSVRAERTSSNVSPPVCVSAGRAAPAAWSLLGGNLRSRAWGAQMCSSSMWICDAAIAAAPVATAIWFSPFVTSPTAYRPGTVVW